jgi:hypothetical protein
MGAKIRAGSAREAAENARREADRAEAEVRIERYGGPAKPSPKIGQCLNGAWAGSKLSAIAV